MPSCVLSDAHAGPHSTAERKRYRVTTSSARARAWARTGGSGAADFVYDEAAGQDEDHEDDKAASGASSAHGSSDSEEESGGEGEVHHVRPRLRHSRLLKTFQKQQVPGIACRCFQYCGGWQVSPKTPL